MANKVENIWTVQSEINDGSNEVKTNTSRVSTASAKQRTLNNESNQNNNNNNNNNDNNNNIINNSIKPGLNHYVGVQSRFQRKYYHKGLVVILIFLLSLISMALIMSLYFGRNGNTLCKTKDCLRAASNLLQSMDFTVNPCDDFYQFTCGNWADDHPRPDSANSFDWFSEKQTKILRYIRTFLQLNSTESEPRSVKETRTMFKACMDTTQMDALGLQPIIDYLNEFHLPSYPTIISAENVESSAMDNFDWIKSIAEIKKITTADIIVGFDIFPDPTNRIRNRIVLGTPETTSVLPFKTDFEKRLKRLQKKNIKEFDEFNEFVMHKNLDDTVNEIDNADDDTVSAYKSYMTEVMSAFVFFANPNANLDVILPLIKKSTMKIIKTTKFLSELAEEAENITKKDVTFASEELINLSVMDFQNATDQAIAPKTLPIWYQYLGILFNSAHSTFNLNDYLVLSSRADVYYLQHLMQFILDTPKIEIELYIWWTIVEEMILHTTSDIRKLHNEYAKSITNLEGTTSRSLYCTSGVNQLMGLAVSYAIAEPNFLLFTKPKVQTMIDNIRLAFDHLVKEITWMDTGTKCSTLEKSNAMKSFIGFPEWILFDGKLDEFYADLKFNRTTHLKNLIDVLRWQMNEKIKTLNSTEDLSWATTPTNVNAFHTFQANAITVPLAILQYPFYNLGLEALNYGAIGTILGHELTHGFDDSGRNFDKNGNMRQWFTNVSIFEYINRTQCFVKQYNEYYIPEVGEHIDGELTLGENIADNGGLREAFYAYKLYTDKNGQEQQLPGLEHFSHEQLLFISFGNLWCETQTTIATKWALEDSHCPGRIRLKGVLANSDEFKNAFNCHPNSKMISKKQCRIW